MRVIEERKLWEGKYLKTTLICYRDKKGSLWEWEAVGRVNSGGVAVVMPVTAENELILIRQYRPALDAYVIEPPAGLVDPGEDPIDTAKRELVEETGYSSENITLLTKGVMSTGIDTERWRIFLALDASEAEKHVLTVNRPDENEDIETIRIPADEVYGTLQSYIDKGEMVDLRIFGLWELSRRRIKGLR